MVRLSECYSSGVGVVKDMDEGFRWLLEAAEANHPTALCKLAKHLCSGNGRLGIAQDLNRAERLLRCCSFLLLCSTKSTVCLLYTSDAADE